MLRDFEKVCSSVLNNNFLRTDYFDKKKNNSIAKISLGDSLKFGVMPQADISEAKLTVGDKKNYHFANCKYNSYDLFDDNKQLICSMIVSDETNAKPYLAISKLVPKIHKRYLCTDEDINLLKNGRTPAKLYVRENTINMANWLSLRYKLCLKNKFGTSISSDNEVVNFDYSLYVADNNDKILEIEHYPSGAINIFATILIPAKQITNITHNPK